MGHTKAETQRQYRLAQEIRQLSESQFVIFAEGVPNVIEGFRQPYYETPEFDGLCSPDPYHKEPGTIVEIMIKGRGSDDIIALDRLAPVPFSSQEWTSRPVDPRDGTEVYEMVHLPTARCFMLFISANPDPKTINPLTDCFAMVNGGGPYDATTIALGRSAIARHLNSVGGWPYRETGGRMSLLDAMRGES